MARIDSLVFWLNAGQVCAECDFLVLWDQEIASHFEVHPMYSMYCIVSYSWSVHTAHASRETRITRTLSIRPVDCGKERNSSAREQ